MGKSNLIGSSSSVSLQASLRNLVLDITPSEQLASANAWHGRFNHFGNIVGFTMGKMQVW